jgi:glutathione S-transferase
MDTHKNARLAPKGREQMVRAVMEGDLSKAAAARWRVQLTRALDVMAREVDQLPEQPMLGHFAVACLLGYLDFRHPDFRWRVGRTNLSACCAQIESRPRLRATAPK